MDNINDFIDDLVGSKQSAIDKVLDVPLSNFDGISEELTPETESYEKIENTTPNGGSVTIEKKVKSSKKNELYVTVREQRNRAKRR